VILAVWPCSIFNVESLSQSPSCANAGATAISAAKATARSIVPIFFNNAIPPIPGKSPDSPAALKHRVENRQIHNIYYIFLTVFCQENGGRHIFTGPAPPRGNLKMRQKETSCTRAPVYAIMTGTDIFLTILEVYIPNFVGGKQHGG
jgi:hypothetical protein